MEVWRGQMELIKETIKRTRGRGNERGEEAEEMSGWGVEEWNEDVEGTYKRVTRIKDACG